MKNQLLIWLVVFLLGAVLAFTGCSKDDDDNQNAVISYQLRFSNISDNPYLVEINGSSDVLGGHNFKDYILEKGTYAWKVTQQSGYLFYPTIQEGTVTLDQEREIIFP